ncbi:hypothetical protein [Endozoicomonas sp.]|uniref:hypothetical protein n=1 Tax=Endozoicomonas sp. TaxID=1892382 RepID=UPI00383B7D79
MSLEAKVKDLQSKHNDLDHAFHENNKILEATHGVVSLVLNEQRERFQKIETDLDQFRHEANQRFDKTEELLIQIVNHLSK